MRFTLKATSCDPFHFALIALTVSIAAYITFVVLIVTLFAAPTLLVIVILQECAGCFVTLWKAVRRYSLRSLFIWTTEASIGCFVIKAAGLTATLAVLSFLCWLILVLAAVALGGLLVYEFMIALGFVPQESIYQRFHPYSRSSSLEP